MKNILVILMTGLLLTSCWEKSKGNKVGVIVKCAYTGLFIKTYECEIIRGGINNANGVFGSSFHFTVENKNDIPILEYALNNQKEVQISYHQELVTLWRTETHDNSFLDSIKIINKDN